MPHEFDERLIRALEHIGHGLSRSRSEGVCKDDLRQLEDRIMNALDTALAALASLSTVADSTSLKVDANEVAINRLIAAFSGSTVLTPEQTAALAAAKVTTAALVASGDKLDAEVEAVDRVLPTPAPAGKV